MKYSVVTFGCRVNQADSLGFEEELRATGAVATSPEQADIVIVNTCSVTASADQSARQTVRRVARSNPSAFATAPIEYRSAWWRRVVCPSRATIVPPIELSREG